MTCQLISIIHQLHNGEWAFNSSLLLAHRFLHQVVISECFTFSSFLSLFMYFKFEAKFVSKSVSQSVKSDKEGIHFHVLIQRITPPPPPKKNVTEFKLKV